MSKISFIVLCASLFLLANFYSYLFILDYPYQRQFQKNGVHVRATVLKKQIQDKPFRSGMRITYRTIAIAFTTQDSLFGGVGNLSGRRVSAHHVAILTPQQWNKININDTIDVCYIPAKIGDSRAIRTSREIQNHPVLYQILAFTLPTLLFLLLILFRKKIYR